MKARRRQNAIDNLNATSACADSVTDTVARCGPLLIKAETVNRQTGYKTGRTPRRDFLRGM
nr:MAG TPA: hypothetical protein [Caudoviricetes sp.]